MKATTPYPIRECSQHTSHSNTNTHTHTRITIVKKWWGYIERKKWIDKLQLFTLNSSYNPINFWSTYKFSKHNPHVLIIYF